MAKIVTDTERKSKSELQLLKFAIIYLLGTLKYPKRFCRNGKNHPFLLFCKCRNRIMLAGEGVLFYLS